MDLGLISVRYARALLKAGIEAGVSDRVYNDMLTVLESYAKVPQFKATIDNPMLSRQQKGDLLIAAAGGASCELTRAFF